MIIIMIVVVVFAIHFGYYAIRMKNVFSSCFISFLLRWDDVLNLRFLLIEHMNFWKKKKFGTLIYLNDFFFFLFQTEHKILLMKLNIIIFFFE